MHNQSVQSVLLSFLFVLIYGSGFVGAKLGLLYSEPFTFLAMRFALAGALLIAAAFLLGVKWPRRPGWLLLSGLLMQGVFSVGVFYALYLGMKPAVSALIIALQPLLVTVLAGPYLGERVLKQRWIGLAFGMVGVALVVADGLAVEGITWLNLSWAVLSLSGLTLGQLIQKKHCADMNLISGGAVQVLATLPLMLILGALFETGELIWHPDLLIAIFWMSVGVSIGALTLLYILLLKNSASQVASVFYGVPVAAALIAWPLFDQVPASVDWIGFGIVALGIWVANSSFRGFRLRKRVTP
ncbi:DMT family transporter [Amphritea atlantica]|uniref:DMT family transporter n=1 Tax=Amphritea atlantica TaxID=355243 RepID=A0ABY5GVU1_9GAMM|nr:DMT family transporter [Amphritea atlantica]